MYSYTTPTLHGFEKQRQCEYALFLWTGSDTFQWMVQLQWEQGDLQRDTRGHSGAFLSTCYFLVQDVQEQQVGGEM